MSAKEQSVNTGDRVRGNRADDLSTVDDDLEVVGVVVVAYDRFADVQLDDGTRTLFPCERLQT